MAIACGARMNEGAKTVENPKAGYAARWDSPHNRLGNLDFSPAKAKFKHFKQCCTISLAHLETI